MTNYVTCSGHFSELTNLRCSSTITIPLHTREWQFLNLPVMFTDMSSMFISTPEFSKYVLFCWLYLQHIRLFIFMAKSYNKQAIKTLWSVSEDEGEA